MGRAPLWLCLGLVGCDLGGEEGDDRSEAPVVVRVTYDDGDSGDLEVPAAAGVPRGIALDVWFDRFLDPDSVDAKAIRVESSTLGVQASVSYDPLDRRIRLTPSRSLDPSLTYRLLVTPEIRSLAGTPARDFSHELSTGPDDGGAPPEPVPVGWALAEAKIRGTCEAGSCHGDNISLPFCGQDGGPPFGTPVDYLSAMGMDLDDSFGLIATAIDVRSRQWPRFFRIEPGRPDRSYVVYKMADFEEEFIVGNVMPTVQARGAGVTANGGAPEGFCCEEDDLPLVFPPPFADPVGRKDPRFYKNRSGQNRDPFVWDCACTDRRARFAAPPGICNVAEDRCTGGEDEDGDGQADCADADCHFSQACLFELVCDDGIDEDGDELPDCTDADCVLQGVCPDEEAACEGGGDACSRPECGGVEDCCEEDGDADGRPDCLGPACAFVAACHDGLGTPGPEGIAYCRARLVSDWIAQGAQLGPGRETCAHACSLRCDDSISYEDCFGGCLDGSFDEGSASCLRDGLCTAYDRDLPSVDPDLGVIDLGEVDDGCEATCAGVAVDTCTDEPGCAAACAAACADLAAVCDEVSSCG